MWALPSVGDSATEYYLFVSDLGLSLPSEDVVRSASMVSILKTLQSLFCLGKQIQYLKLGSGTEEQRPNLAVTYSWAKSFKLILEHRILSLAAFKPPRSDFLSTADRKEVAFARATLTPIKQQKSRPVNQFRQT